MKKAELYSQISEETGVSGHMVEVVCNRMLGAIASSMASGDAVNLAGFGVFTAKDRAARTGRNPQTGETIEIKASRAATFKPAKALKDALNGGDA